MKDSQRGILEERKKGVSDLMDSNLWGLVEGACCHPCEGQWRVAELPSWNFWNVCSCSKLLAEITLAAHKLECQQYPLIITLATNLNDSSVQVVEILSLSVNRILINGAHATCLGMVWPPLSYWKTTLCQLLLRPKYTRYQWNTYQTVQISKFLRWEIQPNHQWPVLFSIVSNINQARCES